VKWTRDDETNAQGRRKARAPISKRKNSMTRIINERTINVKDKTPHSMGVRQGVDVTMAIVSHRSRPGIPLLLFGVVDASGIETAVPMDAASVRRIANEMLKHAAEMESLQ
jgi:hypothetical protein